ncbi:MAG: hypothetical protein M1269_05085 [Chloroflexi bacterium]|nr:hypothetical protein [Chloroflexota bacterium]
MSETFDNVLLIALPASGKSEVRTYLKSLSPEALREEFHIGDMVQLDDFPYVHMMRRIDDELKALGEKPVFFYSPDKPFIDPVSWGILIEMLNEDYADMKANRKSMPEKAAENLLRRFDNARIKLGSAPLLLEGGRPKISQEKFEKLLEKLEDETRDLYRKKFDEYPADMKGKTVIIEFARGGPDGASMPLPAPLGYEYSLGVLSPDILKAAAILYIWVSPEESRRKNFDRADPNDPGSILAHGVPIDVMMNDYGCDDIDYLLETSGKKNMVKIKTAGGDTFVPLARFDNRVDKTSFIRKKEWKDEEIKSLHNGLKEAAGKLIEAYMAIKV